MPTIELRTSLGASSATDLTLTIQTKTYDYLMSSDAPEIRVSAFFDRDWDQVETEYAELYLNPETKDCFKIKNISPGSRTRKVKLPAPMKNGEQLTIMVSRVAREA